MIKKILRLLSIILIVQTNLFASHVAKQDENASDDWIAINSEEDFRLIEENLAGHYKLTSDIVFTKPLQPIADIKKPFVGIFDGQFHKLIDVHISEDSIIEGNSSADGFAGLFAFTYNATIKNIRFIEPTIAIPAVPIRDFERYTIGFVAGYAQGGNFSNITFNNLNVDFKNKNRDLYWAVYREK